MSVPMPPPDAAPLLPPAYFSPSLSLTQVRAILSVYRRPIVVITLAAAAFALLVSLLLPKTYLATAMVQLQAPTRDVESGQQLPGELAQSYYSTQVDLIGSPSVLMAAVDQLGWAGDAEFTRGAPADAPGGVRAWLMEERLGKNLKIVGGNKDSRLISITYGGASADEAAKGANAVARSYIATLERSDAGPDADRAKTYTGQLDELRQKVDAAQAKLTAFREKTGVIDIEQKGSVDIEQERLLDLERRLIAAESDQQLADLRLRASQRDAASASDVLQSASVQALKAAQANLEQRLAQLSATLGPRHPEVLSTRSQLASIRERLGRETGTYTESLRSQASTSSGDAALLRKARDAQRARVLELRGQQDEGAALLRALDAAKLVYDESLKSYDQVVLSQARRGVNAVLVAEALPPLRKARPKNGLNLLLGLVGGFICACLGCLLWELTHRRVRCAEDLEQILGEAPIAVLGVQP